MIQVPHISNFTDFNALAAQPDVRVRYIRQPQELVGVDMVILPGSKIRSATSAGCRESGMAHAVLQARRQGVPVLGICGGYQMPGETIIDEVSRAWHAKPGLGGLLNTVTHFCAKRRRPGNGDPATAALPAWLAATAGADRKRLRNSYGRNRAARRLPFADAITKAA